MSLAHVSPLVHLAARGIAFCWSRCLRQVVVIGVLELHELEVLILVPLLRCRLYPYCCGGQKFEGVNLGVTVTGCNHGPRAWVPVGEDRFPQPVVRSRSLFPMSGEVQV